MHNPTYQERARFAYAAGNTELAEALEKCAELEEQNEELAEALDKCAELKAENERLVGRIWDLERLLMRLSGLPPRLSPMN